LERQREYRANPWSFRPILLGPRRVRLLVVTDGAGSFGPADLGLGTLLEELDDGSGPWVRFEATTAHRRGDSTADLQDFRFDGHDLSGYDQVWLLGVEGPETPLDDPEVEAVARFMASGGGVLAAGGARGVGAGLSGRIPRVRSMRAWPGTGPQGVRHRPDGGAAVDDDPVPITARRYPVPGPGRSLPHPVLSGPGGPITHLPGRPGDGPCLEPGPGSGPGDEFPAGTWPQVLAWTLPDRSGPCTDGRLAGRLAGYDGHPAGQGRVVVDAGWRAFRNVVLTGENGDPDPGRAVGPAASAASWSAREGLTGYHRNLAVWLATPTGQAAMCWRAIWWARWHHLLADDLAGAVPGARPSVHQLIGIGRRAAGALGRYTGTATVRQWSVRHLLGPAAGDRARLPDLLDPWRADRSDPVPDAGLDAVPDAMLDAVLDAVLGAAVHGLAVRYPVADGETRARAEGARLADETAHAVRMALDLLADLAGEDAARLAALARALRHDAGRMSRP
jgi:hypothetical protein